MTHRFAFHVSGVEPARRIGHVRKIAPGRVEASGPLAAMGDICEIGGDRGRSGVFAEVAAVDAERIVLVPLDQTATVLPDDVVVARPRQSEAPVGDCFAGRAVDAMGRAFDGGPTIECHLRAPLAGRVLEPLARREPDTVLETGIRAIDGLLTLGRGQRVGIFSASGVGKTTLVRQLAAQIDADRCVLCLVGERGREVEAIWRTISRLERPERFTCVAATSDLSAPLRVRALHQALALAEHWRDAGEHVLVIVDSITRFAMALREIGLAAGAPPTLRAYTPNVFSALPRVVERCGAAKAGGAITAIMTVLAETDDVDDPIVEVMKALLDGHIVLSRYLAEQNHFPAIDVVKSVSRQSETLQRPVHAEAARRAISLLSTYEDARVMIESGIYKPSANARLDQAVELRPALQEFLRQTSAERTPLGETQTWLQSATERGLRHA
jgi:flagellum-specific ATP synthase